MDEGEQRRVEALERLAAAMERQAAASEHLNDLAASEAVTEPQEVQEVELFDAPACPHCGTLDPMTQTSGGEGRLSQFVLATPCGNCGQPIYAMPIGWRIVGDVEVARDMLSTKDGLLKGHT